MAPFSVAQLKESATNVKNSGTDAFQSVRAKLSGQPNAKGSTYVPPTQVRKGPPPPPPPKRYDRQDTNAPAVTAAPPGSSRPPPPVVRRETRPPVDRNDIQSSVNGPSSTVPSFVPPNRPARASKDSQTINWSALKAEDKQLFFGWLDEYFGRDKGNTVNKPQDKSAPSQAVVEPLAQVARATVQSDTTPTSTVDDLGMSYPPPTEYGSSGLDLCMFFSSETKWDSPWYSLDNPVPPPLLGVAHCIHPRSWQQMNDQKTLSGGVLFNDLSMCWYTVQWSNQNPGDISAVRRRAAYMARPGALSRDELITAHETYGETIAAFAEGYEGTGKWCARGECWDLASEGLKSFEQWDYYIPKPISSIWRTQGHLIYEGKAWGKGRHCQAGRWRGGDDRIRRGDIVEWRTAFISEKYMTFNLGTPDHTAIIVSDQKPRRAVKDGESLPPTDLVQLEVVEQNVNTPPSRQVYHLEGMEKGELWIYRPIGMEAYLGLIFSGQWPDGLDAAVET